MRTNNDYARKNEEFIGLLEDGHVKQAADSATEFTRTTMYENSLVEIPLPSIEVQNSDLVPQIDNNDMVILVELQPDSPGAVTVGFLGEADKFYSRVKRYACNFVRIHSPRAVIDIDELRTINMDVRLLLTDIQMKMLSYEKDRNALAAVDNYLGPVDTNTRLGVAQHKTVAGGISTRASAVESLNIMKRTTNRLSPAVCVLNYIYWSEFVKWPRAEIGNDKTYDIAVRGSMDEEWLGVRWVATLKTDIVPDGVVYQFTRPDALGKNMSLSPPTMLMEKKGRVLTYDLAEIASLTYGHIGGLAKMRA